MIFSDKASESDSFESRLSVVETDFDKLRTSLDESRQDMDRQASAVRDELGNETSLRSAQNREFKKLLEGVSIVNYALMRRAWLCSSSALSWRVFRGSSRLYWLSGLGLKNGREVAGYQYRRDALGVK